MESKLRSISVSVGLVGQRLDQALVTAGLVESRSQGQKLIQNQKAWVNDKPEKSSYKVQMGDLLRVEVEAPASLELIPYEFDLDVVFEDEQVIVVNKPAGLVVHPAYGHQDDTLINALLYRKTQLSPSEDAFRPGLVHRIDKGTSGLLVLAKTESAHRYLARQFLKKTIHRRYWALCFANKKLNSGKLESYLTRDPNNRQRFVSRQIPPGKFAITHFKTLAQVNEFQLFELQLETGRTHQIRVHLSSQHCPIVADEVYGGMHLAKNLKSQKLKALIQALPRFALHARELGFRHPVSGEEMRFTAPLPLDLHPLFEGSGFADFIR